jgi:hypothetical protein
MKRGASEALKSKKEKRKGKKEEMKVNWRKRERRGRA